MKKQLAAKYQHKEVESGKYQLWIKNGYFTAGDKTKEPYTIVIPPPNVTGKLHLGHAWDTTLQDIISRYKRMQGYDMLWLPGMDHAGIATQAKVDARLREQGIDPRSMDREEWLKHAWAWKEEYAENIHQQWAKMGLSLDYTRERFTLDEGLNHAVRTVFVKLYEEGLIYRGERIINWDPVQMTALSNEEVTYQDDKGAFYHMRYFLEGSDTEYLEVATTRPETMFGDTGVAVNPKDERYQKYIGKNVILPVVNKPIPVVADQHADPEFGTGVVKITPAHDPNDFEVGNRHNLPRVVCMNPNATMNENAGKYCGMDRYECREALVNDLKEMGILVSVEEMVHNVGHSQRSGAQIEPYLSKQWFVKMRPLADAVLDNQKNTDTKVNFVPERFEKIMNHWMEITYDWCISRQLWWGHRIPAWYRGEEVYVGMEAPEGEGWKQDEDVLDTWFSSALWPFSTLGWPNETEDFKRYYSNNCLVTGYDIIPFWVNRMTFQGLHFTGKRPFKDCLIHGLIRDELGQKMSKSLGNGIDPMDVIDQYGVDALRFFLTTNSTPGQDMRYIPAKVEAAWNFINKIWNASRFVMMNLPEDFTDKDVDLTNLSVTDTWILHRLNETLKNIGTNMDRYEFAMVGNEVERFVWDDFCSWYIELSKSSLNSEDEKIKKAAVSTLYTVLKAIIKILHPFMPFVTEELYEALCGEVCCISEWPQAIDGIDADKASEIDLLLSIITTVRQIKKDYKLKPSAPISILVQNAEENTVELDVHLKAILEKMCKASIADTISGEELVRPILNGSIRVPMGEIVDPEEEKAKLNKEKERLEKEIARSETMLNNPNFVSKAPAAKIQSERDKLAGYQTQYQIVCDQLSKMN
ncbi:MAG: valine--tRNA ligase [Erysipelotrichaceae bacterium]|nr:valine--tRNA ligase [Erysipelotrichaceae bacterium]